jgi:isopentenyl diphosphate isomerase/L-lactate dehydrogenase-like FMN-dependent dehydrogenase
LYALAVGGTAGVRRMLTLLTEEFAETMVLTGHAAPDTIGPDAVLPPGPPYPARSHG